MDETLFEKPTARSDPGTQTTPQGLKSFGLPAESDIVGDRFRIGKRIGVGGMGAVYEGTDLTDGAAVAVKAVTWGDESIAAQVIGRMRREGKLVAQIHSPHVVRVVGDGVFLHGDMPMLAMERLHGEDLHRVLTRVSRLPPETVLKIGIQAAKGLAAAHHLGIIHRDIKPPNLFLTRREDSDELVLKILDFGIARGSNPVEANLTQGLTQTGTILGSPTYMSPEQIQATSGVTPAADLWSLWITLYQLICGVTPHELEHGSAVGALLVKICAVPAPPISDHVPTISRSIASAFSRALDMNPANRFQTAEEVARELERLLEPEESKLLIPDIRPATKVLAKAGPKPLQPPAAALVGWGNLPESAAAPGEPLQLGVEPARPAPPPPAPKSAVRYDLILAGVMLVGGIAGVSMAISSTRPSNDANEDVPGAYSAASPSAVTSTKSQATVAPPSTGVVVPGPLEAWVQVPSQVMIEVNGRPAIVDHERVKLTGARGSTHRVFMKRGHVAKEVIVTLTGTGPIPEAIDFPNVGLPSSTPASTLAAPK